MSTLSQHIKSQPPRPMREWADLFGISRPYLIALLAGDRAPSLDVAKRIEAASGGAVPITAWPNIQAMAQAISARTQHEDTPQ